MTGLQSELECIGTNGSRVAVVDKNAQLKYTDDGYAFSSIINAAGCGRPQRIKGSGSTWVMCGATGIVYSLDNCETWAAATWDTQPLSHGLWSLDLDIGGGLVVVVGQHAQNTGDARIFTAPLSDPSVFTEQANNFGTDQVISVAFLGGQL